MIKEVKIAESDVTYIKKIIDGIEKLENKIAALEITKLEVFDELKKVKEIYTQFSSTLREKYNVIADDAEIDIDNKCIKFSVDEETKNIVTEEEKK